MPNLTKPRPGARLNLAHPLSRGLVGWWLMNEGGGNVLSDISNDSNLATMTSTMLPNMAWVGSERGAALRFNGTSDFLTGNVRVPVSNASWSFLGWIYPTDVATRRSVIWFNAGVNLAGIEVGNGGGSVSSLVLDDGSFWMIGANNSIIVNQWNHIAITVSGLGTANRNLFVNGVNVNNIFSGVGVAGNFTLFEIGKRTGASQHFQGFMSSASLYSRPLSVFEVQQSFRNPYANILHALPTFYSFPATLSAGSIPIAMHTYQRRRIS